MATTTVFRTRNWVSILYPESAVENWLHILREELVPAFVSPLHDSDVDEDGVLKKPHHHIIIMFDGPKTFEQAQEVFDKIGAIRCQKVKSMKGECRYLCHLDHPEKARYEIDDVISICGADYLEEIERPTDKRELLKEIQFYIMGNDVRSFRDLADYALENRNDWYIIITEKYAYYLDKYIKSSHWSNNNLGG